MRDNFDEEVDVTRSGLSAPNTLLMLSLSYPLRHPSPRLCRFLLCQRC